MHDTGVVDLDDGLHPNDNRGVLRYTAADPDSPLHGDREAPDGESGHKPRTGEQSAQISQAGGPDAGHSSALLLPVPVTLQGAHPLDYHSAAENDRLARHRGLLQPPVFLPSDALHKFGGESHPVQPHVDQVQGRLPQAVRLRIHQAEKEENVGAYGNLHDRLDQLQQQSIGLLATAQQQQELQRKGTVQRSRRVRGQTDPIAFAHGRRGRKHR